MYLVLAQRFGIRASILFDHYRIVTWDESEHEGRMGTAVSIRADPILHYVSRFAPDVGNIFINPSGTSEQPADCGQVLQP